MTQTMFAEEIAAFVRGLENKDPRQVLERGTAAVKAQPESTVGLLQDFRAAVSEADDQVALMLLDELDRRFDAEEASETALFRRIVGATEAYDRRSSVRRELVNYQQELGRVDALRGRILTQAGLTLEPERGGSHPDERQQLLDLSDTLLELERTLASRTERVEPALDAVEIPPTIAVTQIESPDDPAAGSTVSVTARLRNVGDSPTQAVSVEATTTGIASVQSADREVPPIEPRAERAVEFRVRTEETGTGLVSVDASLTPRNSHSNSVQLVVARNTPTAVPLTGEQPADLDEDGLYEDLNSDGQVNLDDVRVLFSLLNSEEGDEYLENNSAFFDFNDDNRISISDVHVLFDRLR